MPGIVHARDRMRPGTMAVAWNDSADLALARMQKARLDAIPVVDDRRVIGFLERSAAYACERVGNWLGSVSVASVMRNGAFVCLADDRLEHAHAAMDHLKVDQLAVVDEAGQVIGIISREEQIAVLPSLVPAFYRSY